MAMTGLRRWGVAPPRSCRPHPPAAPPRTSVRAPALSPAARGSAARLPPPHAQFGTSSSSANDHGSAFAAAHPGCQPLACRQAGASAARCAAAFQWRPSLRRSLSNTAASVASISGLKASPHQAKCRALPAAARVAHHPELARAAPGLVVLYQPLLQPVSDNRQASSTTKGPKRRQQASTERTLRRRPAAC